MPEKPIWCDVKLSKVDEQKKNIPDSRTGKAATTKIKSNKTRSPNFHNFYASNRSGERRRKKKRQKFSALLFMNENAHKRRTNAIKTINF